MAEIKSTLDLVMERTRNMVQSDEDRARERAREVENQARGMLLALTEGRMFVDELPEVLTEDEVRRALMRVMVQDIDPGKDNETLLDALGKVIPAERQEDFERMAASLSEYDEKRKEIAREALDRAGRALEKSGIRGSAVHPNLTVDPSYADALDKLKTSSRARLSRLMNRFF
jgi:hypothetical protein